MGTEKFPLWQYYKDVLEWFEQEPLPRQHYEPPAAHYRGRIQSDLLTPYREMTHSCLLLMRIIDRHAAAQFLEDLPGYRR
jgi:hypothetical protein